MANYVKSNVGNILVVDDETAKMVNVIGFHESMAGKIDDEIRAKRAFQYRRC